LTNVTRTFPAVTNKKNVPTWRLSLDRNFTPDLLVYASYNRGFKSGTFNLNNPAQAPTAPEYIDAFEVGTKADLFDRRLRINTSAYYYDFKNLQLQAFAPGGGSSTLLYNAARSTIKGLEVSVEAAPTKGLTLYGSVAYTDAKYKNFPDAIFSSRRPTGGNATMRASANGNELIRTPKWTANIGGSYTVPASFGDVTLAASYSYNDGFYWQPDNRVRQPSYSLVNADISLESRDGLWRFHVYATNLFDIRYYNFAETSNSLGDVGTPGKPRIVGIGVKRKFN